MTEPTKPILVYAEDNQDTRESYTYMLEDNYDVRACENGKLALDAILALVAEGKTPALLTDKSMPVMDGIDLLRALRDQKIDLPTVMASAGLNTAQQLKDADLQPDMVLDKGFEFPILKLALETAIKKHATRQPSTPMDHAARASDSSITKN